MIDWALELADNPNTYTPLGPESERIVTDRWVLWLGRVKMKGGASHVELDQEFAIHTVLRNGKVTAVRSFLAWEEALDAVGLRE